MPKSLISYVNGRYTYNSNAFVHIEDRGYQFADGIYEVISYINGKWVDIEEHLDRLEYSLSVLQIGMPMARKAMLHVINHLMRLNRIRNTGYIYIQITRGEAPRNHVFPDAPKPAIVMTVKRLTPPSLDKALEGIKVISGEETRWKRPDIKSISLLPNILAKQKAATENAGEYWFVKDQNITEGSSSNAWIVNDHNELITTPANGAILNGITRNRIIKKATQKGFVVIERFFTIDEAYKAQEAFVSSSTALIRPVTQIDDVFINNGKVGAITKSLITLFYQDFNLV